MQTHRVKVDKIISAYHMQQTMKVIHTLNDGSTLCTVSAKEFITIPTWNGNRIMDHTHVESIRTAVGKNIKTLDNGYKLALFHEMDAGGTPKRQLYIIDGQHRAEVVRQFYRDYPTEPDFEIVILQKEVDTEGDAVMYFNALNHTKSITWTDPTLLANMYISALEQAFNTKRIFIRKGTTHRPYLSADKVRDALLKLTLKGTKADINTFIQRVQEYNTKTLKEYETKLAYDIDIKDEALVKKAVESKFTLAMNQKLPWISLI